MKEVYTIQDFDTLLDEFDFLFNEKKINRAHGQYERYRDKNERDKTGAATSASYDEPGRREQAAQRILKIMESDKWKNSMDEFFKLRSQDPRYLGYWEWRKAENVRQGSDPKFRAAVQQGCDKRALNDEWRSNHAKAMGTPEKRKKLSDRFSKDKNPLYKGPMYGIDDDGVEQIMLCGGKEMKAAGYQPSGICRAYKTGGKYKGLRWIRK